MSNNSNCLDLSLHVLASANREGTTCSFADPAFVVYSSVASFYVPFIVTLLVYAQICVVLRRRGRRTAPPRKHGLLTQSGAGEGRHRKVEYGEVFFKPSCLLLLLVLFYLINLKFTLNSQKIFFLFFITVQCTCKKTYLLLLS